MESPQPPWVTFSRTTLPSYWFYFPWGPTQVEVDSNCGFSPFGHHFFKEQWLNKMFWVSASHNQYLKIKNQLYYGLMGIFTPTALCWAAGRMQLSGTALGMSGNSFGTQRQDGCSSASHEEGQCEGSALWHHFHSLRTFQSQMYWRKSCSHCPISNPWLFPYHSAEGTRWRAPSIVTFWPSKQIPVFCNLEISLQFGISFQVSVVSMLGAVSLRWQYSHPKGRTLPRGRRKCLLPLLQGLLSTEIQFWAVLVHCFMSW